MVLQNKAFIAGFTSDPTWGVEVKQLKDSFHFEMSTLSQLEPVSRGDPDAKLTEEEAPFAYSQACVQEAAVALLTRICPLFR